MLNYIIKFGIIILICTPIYLLIRKPWKNDLKREICLGIFILSTLGVLVLAFETEFMNPIEMFKYGISRLTTGESINMVPFRTIRTFMEHSSVDALLVNLLGNIVMFIPWGFGIVLLWKKNWKIKRIVLLSFTITAFIEFVQLFIGRSVDVDDLILNFVGAILGSVMYFGLRKIFPGLKGIAK